MAYEAATADLHDVNLIDSFHLEAYGQKTVNYNRDIEAFPLLSRILARSAGARRSTAPRPTWRATRASVGIVDDEVVRR